MKQLLLVLLVACGGAHKEPAAPAPEQHESGMPVELKAFHDVLAPNWHAPQGPDRMVKTCAAIGDFVAKADAVAKAPAPREPAKWTEGTHALVDAVAAMKTACGSDQFDGAFQNVHVRFHALLELAGGEEHHEEEHS